MAAAKPDSNDLIEVEVKLHVHNLQTVRERLHKLGAQETIQRVFEYNVRFEDATNSLMDKFIVLRLRQDHRARLTLKAPTEQIDDDIRARFEAEVEVSDLATMRLILEHLGYHAYMVYEKYRTTYNLDETEIVLDEMPYGDFIEIEGEPDAIRAVLQKLDLQNATRYEQNYIELFNNVKQHLNLDFSDLTFINFADITVPESAFKEPE